MFKFCSFVYSHKHHRLLNFFLRNISIALVSPSVKLHSYILGILHLRRQKARPCQLPFVSMNP